MSVGTAATAHEKAVNEQTKRRPRPVDTQLRLRSGPRGHLPRWAHEAQD